MGWNIVCIVHMPIVFISFYSLWEILLINLEPGFMFQEDDYIALHHFVVVLFFVYLILKVLEIKSSDGGQFYQININHIWRN